MSFSGSYAAGSAGSCAIWTDALARTRDPGQRALIWGNLGTALWRYFELTDDDAALDESIAVRQAAISSGLLGAEDFLKWVHDLRHALRTRYNRAGGSADLDAAIMLADALRGLPSWFRPPPGIWAGWTSECAEDREERARLKVTSAGRVADVAPAALTDTDAAVALCREVIDAAPADYPDHPGLRSNLGAALVMRAGLADACGRPQQAGADLAEAVDLHRAAVRLAPETHPYAVRIIGNLCQALIEQAQRTGNRALLDEAAAAARRGYRLASPGPAADATGTLLITILARRARGVTDPACLSELIEVLEDSAIGEAALPDVAERRLAAAGALSDRYWLTGEVASLTRAIAHCRAALSAPGEEAAAHREAARFGLSTALRYRYERTNEDTDLTEATELARSALSGAAGAGQRADCLGTPGCLPGAGGRGQSWRPRRGHRAYPAGD